MIPDPLPPSSALLAIDPGINGTGWALWRSTGHVAPDEVGVLRKRFEGDGSFVPASNWLAEQLRVVINTRRKTCAVHHSRNCLCIAIPPMVVSCEFPEFQTGASRSMGWMKGDLQKLTYLVGTLGHMTYMTGCVFEAVPVSRWKGQLPKDIVTDRIIEKLGNKTCERLGIKTHAWDATGIGLWRLGVFK